MEKNFNRLLFKALFILIISSCKQKPPIWLEIDSVSENMSTYRLLNAKCSKKGNFKVKYIFFNNPYNIDSSATCKLFCDEKMILETKFSDFGEFFLDSIELKSRKQTFQLLIINDDNYIEFDMPKDPIYLDLINIKNPLVGFVFCPTNDSETRFVYMTLDYQGTENK